MNEIKWNVKSLVDAMGEGEIYLRKGIELIGQKGGCEQFFDPMNEAGFFEPGRNPESVELSDGRGFQVPYWVALDFLLICAKDGNADLAVKVMDVVRNVSQSITDNDGKPDNYHTFRVFSEILGFVPPSIVCLEEIAYVKIWLSSRFDTGGIVHALTQGAMRGFLRSESEQDWRKALKVIEYCTGVRWEERTLGEVVLSERPVALVEDYHLGEMVTAHSHTLGEKVKQPAVDLLLDWVREVYGRESRVGASYLFRPAIEDHAQNHSWAGVDNHCVVAARDALLGWVESGDPCALSYCESLLIDELSVIKRIAIHVHDRAWGILSCGFHDSLSPAVFGIEQFHELYSLLKTRFPDFGEELKQGVLEAIKNIPRLAEVEDPDAHLRSMKCRWLSAIVDRGFEPADVEFRRLGGEVGNGNLASHPEFLIYSESRLGPGPSPYSPQELVAFASSGKIVRTLNAFDEKPTWDGPTKIALVDSLEAAVRLDPSPFLQSLPTFHDAMDCYQHGVLSGFRELWGKREIEDLPHGFSWKTAWPKILEFCRNLVSREEFWEVENVNRQPGMPTKEWTQGLIAELVKIEAQSDYHQEGEPISEVVLEIVQKSMEKLPGTNERTEDSMFQAINSGKGKFIEALFSQAICAVNAVERPSDFRPVIWDQIKSLIERELGLCKDGNYEASTLFGSYLSNLNFFEGEWLIDNLPAIFPMEFLGNFRCAIDGYSYAQPSAPIYSLLMENGVIERALRLPQVGRSSSQQIANRVGLAYLWGVEELDQARFVYLFEEGKEDFLQDVALFFWRISEEKLDAELVDRIFLFWERCIEWSASRESPPGKLLADLSRLSCFFQDLNERGRRLLEPTLPFLWRRGYVMDLTKNLERLLPINPRQVGEVLKDLLEHGSPDTDFEDRWKKIILELSQMGESTIALELAMKLPGLPGMVDVLQKLTSNGRDG
jgi:hypothetical protein